MKTVIKSLKREQVAVALFKMTDGEIYRMGTKPSEEDPQDDFIPNTEYCRFIVEGATITRNTFNTVMTDRDSPILKLCNPYWADIEAKGDVVGFCLSTNNPYHRVLCTHKEFLKPKQSLKVPYAGYVCSARGAFTINGERIEPMTIIKLSGNGVEIFALEDGADLGLLEIEFIGGV